MNKIPIIFDILCMCVFCGCCVFFLSLFLSLEISKDNGPPGLEEMRGCGKDDLGFSSQQPHPGKGKPGGGVLLDCVVSVQPAQRPVGHSYGCHC